MPFVNKYPFVIIYRQYHSNNMCIIYQCQLLFLLANVQLLISNLPISHFLLQ